MQASPGATLVQLEEQTDPFLLPLSLISGVVSSAMVPHGYAMGGASWAFCGRGLFVDTTELNSEHEQQTRA